MTREEALKVVKDFEICFPNEVSDALEILIPELCESEDEKIRKSLIGLVEKFMTDERKEKTLAWLEKMKEYPTNEEMLRTLRAEYEKGVADTIVKYEQKKQKLVPKFKVGDTIKKKGKEYTFTIDEIRDEFYLAEDWRFLPFDQQDKWELVGQKEQKPADSSVYPPSLEEAIKLYYNTYGNDRGGFDYMSLPKFQDIVETFVKDYGQKPAEWSDEDKGMLIRVIDALPEEFRGNSATPGIPKYYFDHLREWLKSLPERFNLQPKQEWSEEDRLILDSIIAVVEEWEDTQSDKEKAYYGATTKSDWLKSLRPQPHWKPSDDQMTRLNECVIEARERHSASTSGYERYRILNSLYTDLKKLM